MMLWMSSSVIADSPLCETFFLLKFTQFGCAKLERLRNKVCGVLTDGCGNKGE